MKASERVNLVEKIGVELQHRYTFDDVDSFLEAYGISTKSFTHGSSKRLYVKDILKTVSEATVLRIAGELGLGVDVNAVEPSANWRDTTQFRLFISHLSAKRRLAMKLRDALGFYAISGFVAHMDIEPTRDWQDELERALNCMDALLAIHTPDFEKSVWSQQEIGFALGRGAKVVSFEMGELPKGFLAKGQAIKWEHRMADEIAKEINRVLLADPRTSERLRSAQAVLQEMYP